MMAFALLREIKAIPQNVFDLLFVTLSVLLKNGAWQTEHVPFFAANIATGVPRRAALCWQPYVSIPLLSFSLHHTQLALIQQNHG